MHGENKSIETVSKDLWINKHNIICWWYIYDWTTDKSGLKTKCNQTEDEGLILI